MDKKKYISPSIKNIMIDTACIIASSSITLGTSDEIIDSSEALANKNRGEWGNLWKKN